MSSQSGPEKPLTPAQTAKPYGTAAKEAAKRAPAKPTTAASLSDSPAVIAKEDPVKAIEKLETRTATVNANNIARVANSQLTTNDDKLLPLMSLKTGKPIEKFPSTSAGIAKLQLTTVDAILKALEAERSGNEEAKRERLRLHIGLTPNPA
ncbi:hypothetical protein LTR08_004781 [Meristemomyces frigidus]|nr:hypothetical protein LTR08_004781 [Meristemomyces frigidus]